MYSDSSLLDATDKTYHVALVLQQRHQHVRREARRAVVQSALHLGVDDPAHLAEASLRTLLSQEPGDGSGQDPLAYLYVGLSLEETSEHKGGQPREDRQDRDEAVKAVSIPGKDASTIYVLKIHLVLKKILMP